MFRLNLYGDAETKRRARTARVGVTAMTAFLLGLNLLILGFHVASGILLGGRTRAIEAGERARAAEIAALRASPEMKALPRLEARLAARGGRIVWAPKLAELARAAPRAVVLEAISIVERNKAQSAAQLSIDGVIPAGSGGDPVRHVGAFVDSLKASAVFREGLSDVALSSVSADELTGATYFRIICPIKGGPTP